jgi:uncharacterized protein YcbX
VTAPARVAELWRYPVKSMAGERVAELRLHPGGAVGDRVVAVVLVDSDRILTARQAPELLSARARWLGDDAVEIVLPAGPAVRSTDPDVAAVLSDWLGRRVRLDRSSDRARTVPASPDDEGSADWSLPPGTLVDEGAVHILDEHSLAAGRGWYPDGDWDRRRFRPNVLLTSRLATGPVGTGVRLGDSALRLTGPARRCVMVARPQPGLPVDRGILRAVVAGADNEFGVYASPLRSGVVRLGDLATSAAAADPTVEEVVSR